MALGIVNTEHAVPQVAKGAKEHLGADAGPASPPEAMLKNDFQCRF